MANKFQRINDDTTAEPPTETKEEPKSEPKKANTNPKEEPNTTNQPEEENFWIPEDNTTIGEPAPAAPTSLSSALTYTTVLVHHELAVGLNFVGWELDEKEAEAWAGLWNQIVPMIDLKYMGLVISAIAVGTIEIIKTSHYIKARKAVGAA